MQVRKAAQEARLEAGWVPAVMSNYEMRAMEAIHALKGKAAVSYPAIRKQMLAMYPDASNENALRLALKNGVPRGAFAKEKASYVLTAASRRHMASMDAARKVPAPKKEQAPQTFETEYERQRAENVSRNQEMLAMLGLASSTQSAPQAKKAAAVGRFQPPKAGERASRRTNSDVHLAAISKARRPKPKRVAVAAVAAGPAAVTACIWVQCDACDKWRRVGQAPAEGAQWQCSMLADPALASCEVPEEVIEEAMEQAMEEAAEEATGKAMQEMMQESGHASTSTQGASSALAPAPAPAPAPATSAADPVPWADTSPCVPATGSPHTAALAQPPLPAAVGVPAER